MAHKLSKVLSFVSQYYCYILYSSNLNRFYTGSTILNPEERLENHLLQYYGSSKFTAQTKDWELFLTVECISIHQARRIEQHIKKMKSSKYIRNLSIYPEIIDKLKVEYK
ncbi:MAG: GIY-YIG nuclease family protein [Bacteroidota bacterium]